MEYSRSGQMTVLAIRNGYIALAKSQCSVQYESDPTSIGQLPLMVEKNVMIIRSTRELYIDLCISVRKTFWVWGRGDHISYVLI